MTDPNARLQHAPTTVASVYREPIKKIGAGLSMFVEATYGLNDAVSLPPGWGGAEADHALVPPIRGP